MTLSGFFCVEIYIGNKSSVVWMEIKMYCILRLKAI
jgi:hypothetical protein